MLGKVMKKSFLCLTFVTLLASCGVSSSSLSESSQEETSSSFESSESDESSSVIENNSEDPNLIFYKDFSGYEDDSLPFFQEGYSTVNSKFGSNYINLIDPEGYIRTCDIDHLTDQMTIILYAHLTNLESLNETALNKVFSYKVESINYYLDESGFSHYDVIDTYEFSHTLTAENIANNSVPGIPAYSVDFSNDPISFSLNGNGANKILITMTSKIEFTVDGKNAGSNFAIHSIKITK